MYSKEDPSPVARSRNILVFALAQRSLDQDMISSTLITRSEAGIRK